MSLVGFWKPTLRQSWCVEVKSSPLEGTGKLGLDRERAAVRIKSPANPVKNSGAYMAPPWSKMARILPHAFMGAHMPVTLGTGMPLSEAALSPEADLERPACN